MNKIKRHTPKIIIKYLLKEFLFSLLIFTSIIFSLILLITFLEELFFLRDKNLTNNLFLLSINLSLIQMPTLLISMSPFIFLFSGIFFFVKLLKTNEIMPMSLSGFSKNFIILIPAIFSFCLGIFIILFLTPISAELSKYYESYKRQYTGNENLIIFSHNGLWLMEKKIDGYNIIKSEKKISQNFKKLNQVTIYKFDDKNNFKERIDSESVLIKKKNWELINAKKLDQPKMQNLIYITNINFDNVKNFFTNPNIFSVWNISKEINEIKKIGYFGQELIITFNKFLSLPFMLFSMVILSTFFTLKTGHQFNNFFYAFIGVLIGIIIYFLGDLSVALGKSGKIPLSLSVWFPVILIITLSFFSITKEKN